MALSKADKPAGTWIYEDMFDLPDDGMRYEIIMGELYEMHSPKWTSEELSSFPDDGRRYEIINGEPYGIPAPGSAHALVIAALIRLLMPLVEGLGGRWATAPLDVFFEGANPVKPDIFAILPQGLAHFVARGVEGSPDFIVEVVSPSNRVHDVLTKSALYGIAGVREYWIVDPEARTIEILTLDRDALRLAQAASGTDVLESPMLGTIPGSVDDLFPTIED